MLFVRQTYTPQSDNSNQLWKPHLQTLADMKNFSAVAVAFCSLVAAVSAAPTPVALPGGFEPISRAEILKRMDTSAANPLEKRTPGGVSADRP